MARAFNEGNLAQTVRNRLLRVGVVAFSATLVAGLMLAHAGAVPGYRLALFVPFLGAAYAIHLGLYGVCGFMAARGIRATCEGLEPVADKDAVRKLRRIGFRVMMSSTATASFATAVLAFGTS